VPFRCFQLLLISNIIFEHRPPDRGIDLDEILDDDDGHRLAVVEELHLGDAAPLLRHIDVFRSMGICRGARRGVSKGVEDCRRLPVLPSGRATPVRPLQGWSARRA
jgi:hypothetical protein